MHVLRVVQGDEQVDVEQCAHRSPEPASDAVRCSSDALFVADAVDQFVGHDPAAMRQDVDAGLGQPPGRGRLRPRLARRTQHRLAGQIADHRADGRALVLRDLLGREENVIGDVDKDGLQRALAACLVDFADQIGTSLVAEGIETVGELKVLTELGITAGQGYLLGRPSVRPKDWASWNSRLDLDGISRHVAGPDQAAGKPHTS